MASVNAHHPVAHLHGGEETKLDHFVRPKGLIVVDPFAIVEEIVGHIRAGVDRDRGDQHGEHE